MATKGLKIADALSNPIGGVDLTNTFLAMCDNMYLKVEQDGTVNCQIPWGVWFDEAAFDAGNEAITNILIPALTYKTLTAIEWQGTSMNELAYDAILASLIDPDGAYKLVNVTKVIW